jgi:hypothetical protein
MNEELVLIFWMHDQLVDFVAFKLFLSNLEIIVYIEGALSDIYVPDTDISPGISNE